MTGLLLLGNGVNIRYIIPKEGTEIWFDSLAIPADAPNPESAHVFIDYMLRPEVIAAVTDFVTYPNPNKEATALVDKSLSGDPLVYPPQEQIDRMFGLSPKPPKVERVMTRAWTKFKTGR